MPKPKVQRQFRRRSIYIVEGMAKNVRRLEFLGNAKGVRDLGDILMFRFLRKLKRRKRNKP